MKNLRIKYLKWRARVHWRAYHAHLDSYDCGYRLAETFSSGMRHHKQKFNTIMSKLRDIDPTIWEEIKL